MNCPYCHRSIPPALLRTEGARALGARRKSFSTGRPRKANVLRCPCGAMTAARAAARGHRCEPDQLKRS